jgi:hypothetical protein
MALTHFFEAINRLGRTEAERASRLGITPRRLLDWRKGEIPETIRLLRRTPELAEAIAEDARQPAEQSA